MSHAFSALAKMVYDREMRFGYGVKARFVPLGNSLGSPLEMHSRVRFLRISEECFFFVALCSLVYQN